MKLKKLISYYIQLKETPDAEFMDCNTLRIGILIFILKQIKKKLGVDK